MTVLKNFDISRLFDSVESYKKELVFLQYIDTEISETSKKLSTLNDERQLLAEGSDLDRVEQEISAEYSKYTSLVSSRDRAYHLVAQGEKSLEQSIDSLSTLDSLETPNGYGLKVIKSDDYLKARIQLVDPEGMIVEDVSLEMTTSADNIIKIQGIVNDVKVHAMETTKSGLDFVDSPVENNRPESVTLEHIESASEKLDIFTRIKTTMADLNEKIVPLVGKAKEISSMVLEHTRQSVNKLKLSINEWGQTSLGEYKSVRKAFSSLTELEEIVTMNEKEAASFESDRNKTRQEMHKLQLEKTRLMSSKFSLRAIAGLKEKRIDTINSKLAEMEQGIEEKKSNVDVLLAESSTLYKTYVDRLVNDTLDVRNKTIGNTTITVEYANDKVYAALSSGGEVLEYVSLDRSGELTMDQVENLKFFNAAVRGLSPQSINLEMQPKGPNDQSTETIQYLNDQKDMYTEAIKIKLKNIERLPENSNNKDVANYATELMGALRDHNDFTNKACDIKCVDGQIVVNILGENQDIVTASYAITPPQNIGLGIMNELSKTASVDDVVYTVDQSEDFVILSKLHVDQYKKLTNQYSRAASKNGVNKETLEKQYAEVNKSMATRMLSMNQTTIGNKMLFVTEHNDGLKMLLRDPSGKTELILVPVGLDGKLQFTQLDEVIARVSMDTRVEKEKMEQVAEQEQEVVKEQQNIVEEVAQQHVVQEAAQEQQNVVEEVAQEQTIHDVISGLRRQTAEKVVEEEIERGM